MFAKTVKELADGLANGSYSSGELAKCYLGRIEKYGGLNAFITVDAEANRIDVAISDDEMTARRDAWQEPPFKFTRGTLYKYIKTVKSASEGCVTDE